MRSDTSGTRPALAAGAVIATICLLLTPGVRAHPGEDHAGDAHAGAVEVLVNSPARLAGTLPATQWADTGDITGQTADLVYAGTGCTPLSYAQVLQSVPGTIVVVDAVESVTNPADRCPAYTFAQKVETAAQAGAIGLVQIPNEGDSRGPGGGALGSIPAVEVDRTAAALALRDAAIAGTANITLHDTILALTAMSDVPCKKGRAGPFDCRGIDLLSFVPQELFGGTGQSDVWGWTDPANGDEYVLIGKTNGVAFLRVTDPTAPVYVGDLPNPAVLQGIWHSVKVYENHMLVVSESQPHGMAVFDLTRLRGATGPQEWDADAFYPLTWAAHNVAVNEDTGFAYIVGGNVGIAVPDHCLSGLHMVDISDPKNPSFAGCYAVDGGPGPTIGSFGEPATTLSPVQYVHDTQCVTYHGPDRRYEGRELCFNASEDSIVIVDVTDKLQPVTVSRTTYPQVTYAHQGWLTSDHAYLLVNDEFDEVEHGQPTRTVVLDVTDLDHPVVHFEHLHNTSSVDHNNFVKDRYVYQSNYTSGLRILDLRFVDHPRDPRLEEVAFFDTFPWHGEPTIEGTWSNYPFFESGTLAVSGINEGLFLLRRSG